MAVYYAGEFVSIMFMAIALGMDAFSVSLGLGMQQLRLKRIAFIGVVIGIFHIIMPFIGILLGQAISGQFGDYTTLIGGLLLFGIGAQMFFSAFNYESPKLVQPAGMGLLFFALSVSLDSFSVGLSLGMSEVRTVVTLLSFATASMVLTWAGMILGRKVHGLLGVYSEMLGGSILCGFGLYVLFG
ncbi:manganese efflux pump [Lentibacillus cibarius]|uniref:Putative manganese efflux pump MntP n=1 Tax=Lentibacillus cibarius TaxID=2583219 RepID=A0A549YFX3_9BACI|nr:manganese efflux pump MntP family protein [Lentibacillus cibarius]TMN22008.1 manganese efflux pump [Lentibacillus cibarius]TRM10783.1 manganese efflux pump [Lentibacillus cibarius]